MYVIVLTCIHSIPFHSISACRPFFRCMFLTEFKSLCVHAGLEYFWVRNNISLYCGALSRVSVGRLFLLRASPRRKLPHGFASGEP